MVLLDGKAVANTILDNLKSRVDAFYNEYGVRPVLVIFSVGEDAASQVYVRNKVNACTKVGIEVYINSYPADISEETLIYNIRWAMSTSFVDGIIVQLPLPKHINEERILRQIPIEKDVDGFSTWNFGLLASNKGCTVACTPQGVMELLKYYNIDVSGKHAVVVGRSNIVGRPLSLLLLNADATVTTCHSRTKNLSEICKTADILISAVGKEKLITADMVKEGAVVIDVGINRNAEGKLCGDVDFENVKDKTSYITPVPGGVGPMTVAMLLKNVCDKAEKRFL